MAAKHTLGPDKRKKEARDILLKLADQCPSSLRMPLILVSEGNEAPGTAEAVLEYGRKAVSEMEGGK